MRMIQVMFRVTARPTVRAPRVMKKAMAPRRRVMFMVWGKYSEGCGCDMICAEMGGVHAAIWTFGAVGPGGDHFSGGVSGVCAAECGADLFGDDALCGL